MEQVFSDPRRRRLGILAVLAALMLIWAVVALWQQGEQLAPKYRPTPLFPDLPHHAREVARIHIAAKSGNFDVAFKPNKGWVITSRHDLPASFEQVNRTVVGMASLETLEPKTARADWLHYLGLGSPPKGDGVSISLMDAKGQTLAAVITGKSEDIGDQSGAGGLFVRKPDSTQAWLAKSVFEPKSDVSDWYDKNLIDIDRKRIAETDVTPQGGPAFTVKRDKPKDATFKLQNVPAGREVAFPGPTDGVATAIVGLTFDGAKPAKGFDFSKSSRTVTHTFDGLTVTVQTVKQGDDYWATVSAQADPGKPAAAREAQAINAKTSSWAYKLPPDKGQQLTANIDNLLKPLPGAKTQQPDAADSAPGH
ncbi:MAG TPA: DUF4340 domain-containing protein [Rhizomicrobium sp.]|nr:DUF4340 domain-containing protein [Rhizomicrobium sp.]